MLAGDGLYDYVKNVKSRDDFVRFIDYLNADYRSKKDEWQNDDLESFLGGLSGFAQDMAGYYRNMGESVDVESITWRMAAEMLLAATVYGN